MKVTKYTKNSQSTQNTIKLRIQGNAELSQNTRLQEY